MVELVDTADLKSADYCSRAGSIPAPGTIYSRGISSTLTSDYALRSPKRWTDPTYMNQWSEVALRFGAGVYRFETL